MITTMAHHLSMACTGPNNNEKPDGAQRPTTFLLEQTCHGLSLAPPGLK